MTEGHLVPDPLVEAAQRVPSSLWLRHRYEHLLSFAADYALPGGFGFNLPESGKAKAVVPDLILTGRLTFVFASAPLENAARTEELAATGVSGLATHFWDDSYGGWIGDPAGTAKNCYEHMFVLLAAAAAAQRGTDGAESLLQRSLEVVDLHFWDEARGVMRESFDRSWSSEESYIGGNSNMHAVEALTAAYAATGDTIHLDRAERIVDHFVHRQLLDGRRMLPEHFSPDLTPLLDYNREKPNDQLRPFGSTVGHWLEWARLLVDLSAARGGDNTRLLTAAEDLFTAAVELGWQADGRPGFVYTLAWDESVSVDLRLRWVLMEAIAAAAALGEATGRESYNSWLGAFWHLAAEAFFPDERPWPHELDSRLRPSALVWNGRPDAYHASTALLASLRRGPHSQ